MTLFEPLELIWNNYKIVYWEICSLNLQESLQKDTA